MSTIRFKALEQLMNRQAVKFEMPDKWYRSIMPKMFSTRPK